METIEEFLDNPINQLKIEQAFLEVGIQNIERYWEEHRKVMESRKNIPFMHQPLDASYWMSNAPTGNVEEMKKRIKEIDRLIREKTK